MAKKVVLGGCLSLLFIVIIGWFGVKALMKSAPEELRSELVRRGNVEIKVVDEPTLNWSAFVHGYESLPVIIPYRVA